jgi:hypothetical protein
MYQYTNYVHGNAYYRDTGEPARHVHIVWYRIQCCGSEIILLKNFSEPDPALTLISVPDPDCSRNTNYIEKFI